MCYNFTLCQLQQPAPQLSLAVGVRNSPPQRALHVSSTETVRRMGWVGWGGGGGGGGEGEGGGKGVWGGGGGKRGVKGWGEGEGEGIEVERNHDRGHR